MRPTAVIRASPRTVIAGPPRPASAGNLRNLRRRNGCPDRPQAGLGKEHRAAALKVDRQRDEGHQQREEGQRAGGEGDIEDAPGNVLFPPRMGREQAVELGMI